VYHVEREAILMYAHIKYHIIVSNDTTANWDGIPFPGAKMINGTFPGPWIRKSLLHYVETDADNA
jgi:hypothetical protein